MVAVRWCVLVTREGGGMKIIYVFFSDFFFQVRELVKGHLRDVINLKPQPKCGFSASVLQWHRH
jgi:hypothetical protein